MMNLRRVSCRFTYAEIVGNENRVVIDCFRPILSETQVLKIAIEIAMFDRCVKLIIRVIDCPDIISDRESRISRATLVFECP